MNMAAKRLKCDFRVYRGAVPHAQIDAVLDAHARFKSSSLSWFRAQGTTRFERPIIDEHGNQVNSIHNPHLLGLSYQLSSSIRTVIFSNEILDCISDFTGHDKHVHWQSMLFDKSTGTKLHQDTWYLDTSPAGNLVGVWIALEDIDEDAGPFCIYSNAAHEVIGNEEFDFDNLEADARFRSRYPNARRYDFLARKGDVLVWSSLAIHGAHLPKRPGLTRKSITSHFYPHGRQVKNPPIKRPLSIYDFEQPKETTNPRIKMAGVIQPILYQTICMAMGSLGRVSRLVTNDRVADPNLSEIRRIG